MGVNPLINAGNAALTPGGMLSQLGGILPQPYFPPQPTTPAIDPGSRFRVEKITNGYLVHLQQSVFSGSERHYAANEKEVGELVTAMLVRWFLGGK